MVDSESNDTDPCYRFQCRPQLTFQLLPFMAGVFDDRKTFPGRFYGGLEQFAQGDSPVYIKRRPQPCTAPGTVTGWSPFRGMV